MPPLIITINSGQNLKIPQPPITKKPRPRITLRSVEKAFLGSQQAFSVLQHFVSSAAIEHLLVYEHNTRAWPLGHANATPLSVGRFRAKRGVQTH